MSSQSASHRKSENVPSPTAGRGGCLLVKHTAKAAIPENNAGDRKSTLETKKIDVSPPGRVSGFDTSFVDNLNLEKLEKRFFDVRRSSDPESQLSISRKPLRARNMERIEYIVNIAKLKDVSVSQHVRLRAGIIPYWKTVDGKCKIWLGRNERSNALSSFSGTRELNQSLLDCIIKEWNDEMLGVVSVDVGKLLASTTIYSQVEVIVFYEINITKEMIDTFKKKVKEKTATFAELNKDITDVYKRHFLEMSEIVELDSSRFFALCDQTLTKPLVSKVDAKEVSAGHEQIYRTIAITVNKCPDLKTILAHSRE